MATSVIITCDHKTNGPKGRFEYKGSKMLYSAEKDKVSYSLDISGAFPKRSQSEASAKRSIFA